MLGYRRGNEYYQSAGARELPCVFGSVRQFFDIFNEEGRSENQGGIGAYVKGRSGRAICESEIGQGIEKEEHTNKFISRGRIK
jgi:hypothetical protein